MAKKSHEWSKETRVVCGVFIIILVAALMVLIFYIGNIVEQYGGPDAFADFEQGDMPIGEECINNTQCTCPMDNPLCKEFGGLVCDEGQCIPKKFADLPE